MSDASASPATAEQSFFEKHHFLLRRLHSLSGIFPVGLFVIMHLFTNFQILVGDMQHEVEFIHSMPALLAIEITLWLSIGFHAGLGFYYTFTGKSNTRQYGYADNWRYLLQRITGIIALVFIFVHISTLRWGWTFGGLINTPFFVKGPNGEKLVATSTAIALKSSIAVTLLYIIGVFSVVYHWSNGLWTAAISWGITISVQAQKRWGMVCAGLFIALSVFSAGAIYGALVYPINSVKLAAYNEMVVKGGGKPVQVPTTDGPSIDTKDVESKINSQNPLGH